MNVYWRGVDTTVDRVLSDHLLTLSVETVATTCLLYRAIHYLKRLATSRFLTFAWGITIAWFPISLLKRVMMFFFFFLLEVPILEPINFVFWRQNQRFAYPVFWTKAMKMSCVTTYMDIVETMNAEACSAQQVLGSAIKNSM